MDQLSRNIPLCFLLHRFNAFGAFPRMHVLISRINLDLTFGPRRLFLLITRRFVLLVSDQVVTFFVVAVVSHKRGAAHVGGLCTCLDFLSVQDLSGYFPFEKVTREAMPYLCPQGDGGP